MDGLRAGRRKLDGSDPQTNPKHQNRGRSAQKCRTLFVMYSGIEKYEQMFYYNFTTTHDRTVWELLKIVRIWYII